VEQIENTGTLESNKSSEQENLHRKHRPAGELSSALEPVKLDILQKRVDTGIDDSAYSDFQSMLDEEALELAATAIVDAFLSGQHILLVGRGTSDHVLAISTFVRAMNLMSRSMHRTRDVIKTERGSIGNDHGDFLVSYHTCESARFCSEERDSLEDMLGQTRPSVVIVLDPVFGLPELVKGDQPEGPTVISLVAGAFPEQEIACGLRLGVVPEDAEVCGEKSLTLSAIAHYLTLRCREQAIQRVVDYPRAQALMAQLNDAPLETNDGFVALSLLLDDLAMTAPVRDLVTGGLERINKGWVFQPRTSHSKGSLCYGLRALLTECDIGHPFTARELQLKLTPMFSAVCYAGYADTLIETLLCEERRIAYDKAARASLVKAKTYFPSLKHLGDLAREEQSMDAVSGTPDRLDPEAIYQCHIEEVSNADARLLPIIAEQRNAELGATQVVVSRGDDDTCRCFIRSDVINVCDAIVRATYTIPVEASNGVFWADAFFGDITLPVSRLDAFRSAITACVQGLAKTGKPVAQSLIIDRALSVNQRTSALALWLERQPWGKGFPEPIFQQNFRVRQSRIVMESHQALTVDDMIKDDRATLGEGFQLIWRDSLKPGYRKLMPHDNIRVNYRLKIKRNRTTTEVYGEVVSLALLTDADSQ